MGVSRRLKDGKWYVFVRHAGKRRAQPCVDEQHAIDTQKFVLQAIAAGQYDIAKVQPKRREAEKVEQEKTSRLTLRQYYEQVLVSLWESSHDTGTLKNYMWAFETHILPTLGEDAITGIDRKRVKAFIQVLCKTTVQARSWQRGDKAPTETLAKATIKLVLGVLSACFAEAVDSEIIGANPVTRVGKYYKQTKKRRETIEPFTANEVSSLLAITCKYYGFENYVLLLTLFHCGLRASECAGLKWCDLDEQNRFLLIRRQFSRGKVKHTTKTDKERSVDVSTALLEELLRLKTQRREKYLRKGSTEIPEWIFVNGNEKPPEMGLFRDRIYNRACDKAKIRRRRLHDTRHTYASLLLMNGEPLKYVSTQLGHSSITMTADTYGHWIPGTNRSAVDRLPNLATSGNLAHFAS